MTPSKISQPLNMVPLPQQSGGGVVAQQPVSFGGGDALLGVSASAWVEAPGEMSFDVWVDGQPTGARLAMYANVQQVHMSLGHTWVWLPGVSPGEHEVTLMAGDTTVTDQNDFVTITLWEMGDGCAVHFSDDEPCPTGTGAPLFKEAFRTNGGTTVMVSASTSGWVTQSQGSFVGASMTLDGGDAYDLEVCANNLNQHLAAVPTDLFGTPQARGQHVVQLESAGNTSTDGGDTAHLTVVEFANPADAPVLVGRLQNDQANTQHGDGGSILSTSFTSHGGPLLVRVSASVWTQSPGEILYVGIQIDGTSRGFAQIYANAAEMHMATITNDLVVTGIANGPHTLNLMGEAGVLTDYNDRVSVTILEFPS